MSHNIYHVITSSPATTSKDVYYLEYTHQEKQRLFSCLQLLPSSMLTTHWLPLILIHHIFGAYFYLHHIGYMVSILKQFSMCVAKYPNIHIISQYRGPTWHQCDQPTNNSEKTRKKRKKLAVVARFEYAHNPSTSQIAINCLLRGRT